MLPYTASWQQQRVLLRCSVSRRDSHINLKVSPLCVNSSEIPFCYGRLTKEKKRLLWITWPPLSYLMSDEGKNIITPCWLDLDCLAPSDNMLLWLSETSCHLDWKIRMTLNIIVLWKQREVTSPYTLKDKTGCLTLASKSSIYSSGSSEWIREMRITANNFGQLWSKTLVVLQLYNGAKLELFHTHVLAQFNSVWQFMSGICISFAVTVVPAWRCVFNWWCACLEKWSTERLKRTPNPAVLLRNSH